MADFCSSLDAMGYYLGLACAVVGGYLLGYGRGLMRGEAHNWLAPLVRRQAEDLRRAWLAADQRPRYGDDWQDRGVGR